MTKKLQRNQNGVAQVMLAAIVIVVIAAIGLVAWKVSSNRSTLTTGINKATQDKCMTEVNDTQYCKFAGAFANVTNYKVAITATDPSAASVNYEFAYDSKNNISMVAKQNGQEQGNVIVYSGVTYSKDYTDGKWFKYAAGNTNAPQTSDIKKEFFKNNFKGDNGQKLGYKKIGTEKCDKLTCYKYQETDPQKPTETNYIWFDTKNYLLRRATSSDSTTKVNSEMTVTYGSVVISVPSPTKDAPTTVQ